MWKDLNAVLVNCPPHDLVLSATYLLVRVVFRAGVTNMEMMLRVSGHNEVLCKMQYVVSIVIQKSATVNRLISR